MPTSNPPPSLPEVYDEAGDSPRWVPVLGAGLFIAFAVLIATSVITQPSTPPTAAPSESGVAAEAEAPRG